MQAENGALSVAIFEFKTPTSSICESWAIAVAVYVLRSDVIFWNISPALMCGVIYF